MKHMSQPKLSSLEQMPEQSRPLPLRGFHHNEGFIEKSQPFCYDTWLTKPAAPKKLEWGVQDEE